MFDRSCGILLPISALPSRYGIGTLGIDAHKFIDFLYESGHRYWQMLPIGPVSYGDSPYQSFSVYAGNPYYIDLNMLIEEGLIKHSDCKMLDFRDSIIDYEKQFRLRFSILRKSYRNAESMYDSELDDFRNKNRFWLKEYSLYMALKIKNNNAPWHEWGEELRLRERKAIALAKLECKDEIKFWEFLQYMFYRQYDGLKCYANKKGVRIIGDMPIYPSLDSSDVWANSGVFMMDEKKAPILVAGVPPDAFSDDGQLWGNPVYNWEHLRKTSFQWWTERIEWSLKLYDAVRIDHFRGFDRFWAVPFGSVNAKSGKWYEAYGKELFDTVNRKIKNVSIIAEDLGIITDSVIHLKKHLGYPGMKVLQFAFDGNPKNPYLPQNYERNCAAYTGTHDNDTLRGWFESLDEQNKKIILSYLGINENISDIQFVTLKMIEALYFSKADLCVIPLQDFLNLNSEGRINTPSTLGINWMFRITENMLDDELAGKLKEMAVKSNRMDFN